MSQYEGKERRCAEHLSDGTFRGRYCHNRGKYREGGKFWCGMHQPSKVKARRKERDRKFTEQWKAKQQRWARTDRINGAERRLLDGVMELDPIPVGCEWLGALIEDVRKARDS